MHALVNSDNCTTVLAVGSCPTCAAPRSPACLALACRMSRWIRELAEVGAVAASDEAEIPGPILRLLVGTTTTQNPDLVPTSAIQRQNVSLYPVQPQQRKPTSEANLNLLTFCAPCMYKPEKPGLGCNISGRVPYTVAHHRQIKDKDFYV